MSFLVTAKGCPTFYTYARADSARKTALMLQHGLRTFIISLLPFCNAYMSAAAAQLHQRPAIRDTRVRRYGNVVAALVAHQLFRACKTRALTSTIEAE